MFYPGVGFSAGGKIDILAERIRQRRGCPVKRKISAILAADVAGYSRLVAEDEEETLRRLGVYGAVFEDFVARWGGRIFNTAGDAALAEFPSSVDAVRCAVDIQESIRSRNLAFPQSRRMSYRVGITVADVVERDGDLLGDGVNIASRLGTLAAPGGICVSRTVYEQVANKLSVKFEDLGQQQMKNIPNAVHAYSIAPPHSAAGTALPGPAARRPRRGLIAGAGVACVLLAVATILGVLGVRDGFLLASAPTQSSRDVAFSFDDAKVRALAASQGVPLPPTVKILAPGSTVPAALAGYLGAWGGDEGWNGTGRHVVLVIENVDETGTALGTLALGPPPDPANPDHRPARYRSIAGSITDAGLVFTLAGSKYTFKSTTDGLMWGRWQPNEHGNAELTITLERLN
jgi:class 3 adenylate cyclase